MDYGILSARLDPAKWDVRTFAYYWYPPTMDHFRFVYEQHVAHVLPECKMVEHPIRKKPEFLGSILLDVFKL